MNDLILVIITMVATLAVVGIGRVIFTRKNAEENVIEKIRPIVLDTIVEAVKIYNASSMGYDALNEYCINYLKEKVDESEFLTDTEKGLLTKELMHSILDPYMKKLWNEGFKASRK